MNNQLDARGAPETKANGGTLHPLKEVMCFVQGFNEGDLAKRDGSPSLTEGKELKDLLVFEDTVHQDEPKLKFWGTYIKDFPAEEMKTVMVFENRPPEATSCRPFLETQKWGQVATLLSVSKSLIYNKTHNNEIPSIRLGKRILVPFSYIKNLMAII